MSGPSGFSQTSSSVLLLGETVLVSFGALQMRSLNNCGIYSLSNLQKWAMRFPLEEMDTQRFPSDYSQYKAGRLRCDGWSS